MHKKLAEIAKRAWELREASWKDDGGFGKYTLDLDDACDKAATELGEPKVARLIYLALEAWSNDVGDWVDEMLNHEA